MNTGASTYQRHSLQPFGSSNNTCGAGAGLLGGSVGSYLKYSVANCIANHPMLSIPIPINDNVNLSLSPAFSLGANGLTAGVSAMASMQFGDWGFSLSAGAGTSMSEATSLSLTTAGAPATASPTTTPKPFRETVSARRTSAQSRSCLEVSQFASQTTFLAIKSTTVGGAAPLKSVSKTSL